MSIEGSKINPPPLRNMQRSRNLIVNTDVTLPEFVDARGEFFPKSTDGRNTFQYPTIITPISQDIQHQYKSNIAQISDRKYHFVLVPDGYRTIVIPDQAVPPLSAPPAPECAQIRQQNPQMIDFLPKIQKSTYKKRPTEPTKRRRTSLVQKRIPRPANSFMTYRMDKQHDVLAQNPHANNRDISIIVGQMWRNESEQVKELYRQKAENGRKVHMLRYPDYKYIPIKRKKCHGTASGASTRKENADAASEASSAEKNALTYWNTDSYTRENYVNEKLQFDKHPVPPLFLDHEKSGKKCINCINNCCVLESQKLCKHLSDQSNRYQVSSHSSGEVSERGFANSHFPQNTTAASSASLGNNHLCSVQSLMSLSNNSLQCEDIYTLPHYL